MLGLSSIFLFNFFYMYFATRPRPALTAVRWWDLGGSTALVDTNICLFLPPVSLTWVPPLQSLSPTSAALFSANFLHPTIFLAPAAHPGHIVVLQLCCAILYCTHCISPAQLHVQLAKEDKALWFLLSFALKFLSLCAAVQVLRAPMHYRQMVGELIVTIASED